MLAWAIFWIVVILSFTVEGGFLTVLIFALLTFPVWFVVLLLYLWFKALSED